MIRYDMSYDFILYHIISHQIFLPFDVTFRATDDVVKQTTKRYHDAVGTLRDVRRETPADTCWTAYQIVFCANAKDITVRFYVCCALKG